MIRLRPSDERGRTRWDWLDSRHSFSFADYHDPAHMGFRSLRVINEDWVDPGSGFPPHPHRDMEILTCVLAGELTHKDSMGTGSTIRPGELQRMSAGTGVIHSEMNPSKTERLHLLQIWILPDRRSRAPEYEQKSFPGGGLRLVASPDGRDGSLTVHQDVLLWKADLGAGATASIPLGAGRGAWIQVARGRIRADGATLSAGDGAAVEKVDHLPCEARDDASFLVFDLA